VRGRIQPCGEARNAERRGTYRLTSGAMLFPPRLILWRLWRTVARVWVRGQRRAGGCGWGAEVSLVSDWMRPSIPSMRIARCTGPICDHVGRVGIGGPAASMGRGPLFAADSE